MQVEIQKPPCGGSIRAISSKSAAHRLLICAALSDKKTDILCADTSKDIDATAECLSAFSAEIKRTADGFFVSPIRKDALPESAKCPVGESGSTFRFLLPIASALGIDTDFFTEGRLPFRPLSPLYEQLLEHGVSLSPQGQVPFRSEGKLHGGKFQIAANVSSQFISGLLFALPLLQEKSEIQLTGKFESRSYVDMTCHALNIFGIKTKFENSVYFIEGKAGYRSPGKVIAEGDWSNAAFWLALGALGEYPIEIFGLNFQSLQGDIAIIELLRSFGARIDISMENGSCVVFPSKLEGIEIDAQNIPDLVPILSLIASQARGSTRIYNAARLRLKESDRLHSVCNVLSTLGANIQETKDGLLIQKSNLHGGVCDSFADHRIAMMSAIASACVDGIVTIHGSEAVAKSYPAFWKDFQSLGAQIIEK